MGERWVVVAATLPVEASLMKGLLESAGIPVRLRGEAIGRLYGLNLGPLGEVEVLVPEGKAAQAREILEEHRG
ncbi:MAG: DUF2007 domain-containing protein [Thermoanaerobacteraceae bacterium]|uniref:putative signal transducing protein n=1 Tax=Thermanaeromonas sp. C210 TaxID=2731925 RepID=UPI00155BDDC4|nr:DUF2007 domain-containing protein [Thermanaeromonas sp. C210]MBE3581026.1 DUF2007 domain-containing protein [Thermoanaerobacteraceae bacterium]GFN24048.1 hypothetical protein TAMC210_23660 [Thermanaeromonas sp. C210]